LLNNAAKPFLYFRSVTHAYFAASPAQGVFAALSPSLAGYIPTQQTGGLPEAVAKAAKNLSA
jgi:hypothetical protein